MYSFIKGRLTSFHADRLTSYRGDDLVQKFHTGAFPDLLYNGSQFFIGLLKVTCSEHHLQILMEVTCGQQVDVNTQTVSSLTSLDVLYLLFWSWVLSWPERTKWHWRWQCRRCWEACSCQPSAVDRKSEEIWYQRIKQSKQNCLVCSN